MTIAATNTHRIYRCRCGHPYWMEVAYIGGRGYVWPQYYDQRPISRNSVTECDECHAPLPRDLMQHADALIAGDLKVEQIKEE